MKSGNPALKLIRAAALLLLPALMVSGCLSSPSSEARAALTVKPWHSPIVLPVDLAGKEPDTPIGTIVFEMLDFHQSLACRVHARNGTVNLVLDDWDRSSMQVSPLRAEIDYAYTIRFLPAGNMTGLAVIGPGNIATGTVGYSSDSSACCGGGYMTRISISPEDSGYCSLLQNPDDRPYGMRMLLVGEQSIDFHMTIN